MTRTEQDQIFEQYYATFNEPLQDPPLSWGHTSFSTDDIAEFGRKALAAGKPIDWADYLEPLPEDAVS